MATPSPTADVSVRLAWADDAPAMADLQCATWRESYADLFPPEVLDALTPEAFEAQWRASLVKPTDARQRVLVALESDQLRGFTAVQPSPDDDADPVADADISELVVGPSARGQGHGSRLVHAAVDTLRSDGFRRATTWLAADADEARAFLTEQGFAPDGAHRTLDLHGDGSVVVKQVRLHTDLQQG